jgi:hypothetical protein
MAGASELMTYHLRILAKPTEAASSAWEVDVYLGGACFAKKVILSDPFSKTDEDECRWYLDDYLKSPFEKGRADIAVEALNSYADNLFDQLHLNRVWRWLTGPTTPTNKVLEIAIIENTESLNAVSSDTIHRLHWEILESPRLWKNLHIQTTVRRIIPQNENSIPSITRVESWSQGVPTVNILLVISRDLTKMGGEVDPNLAFQSMQIVQRDLEARGASFRLNIEIVRPGSFKALKKHLEERSKRRHNGDIHIVHFDVHGQVGLRSKGEEKASTVAFLYFQSGKGDGKLSATRAGAVAELLRKHNIRIVILNACESAKANKGDEANIARTFTKAGVQNVLAMTFKILGSTCTEFMGCFYECFIAGRKPFSIAVRNARERLRCSPNRDARFALSRSLEDWVVPVVYASGKDVELHISSVLDKDFLIESPVSTPISKGRATSLSPLFGRSFDVLRFESVFLESNITRLAGPAGIGKTAFIHHLLRYWEDTGLFEKTLYVDCASLQVDGIQTPKALLQRVLDERSDCSTSDTSEREQTEYRAMISELGYNFEVIVLDNLDASHSDVDEMNEHGRWPESARVALIALIRDIFRITPYGEEDSLSFIFVGRRNDDEWWEEHFPKLPAFQHYPLRGLLLPDAIEFAHNLLGEDGFDTSHWGHEDEVILSQVLNIVQCNPLAIITVLKVAALQDQPWKEVFEKILFHRLPGLHGVTEVSSFLHRDMAFASDSGPLPLVHSNVFAALTLYWHQAGSKDVLNTLLAAEDGLIFEAIEFGVDRGYFSVNHQGFVANIHPLFTIAGRHIFTSAKLALSEPLRWVLGYSQDSMFDLPVPALIRFFFRGITSRKLEDFLWSNAKAGQYTEFEKHCRPAFYNILTCLRLCSLGKETICMDQWPSAVQMYGNAGIWFLSVDEMALLVKQYEIVVRRFISRRPTQTDARTLLLMISIGNFLTSSHLSISTLPTRRGKEFSQLTFDIIDKTDEELLKDQNLVGAVSLAIMSREQADFSQGTKPLAEFPAFRSAISCMEGLSSQVDLNSVTWDQFAEFMPSVPQRAPQIESFLQRREMKVDIAEIQKRIQNGASAAELAATGLAGFNFKHAKDDLSAVFGYTQDPRARSKDLELSLDARNRVEAIKHHKALLLHAMKERNLELVMELQNSLIGIYRTDEAYTKDLNQMLEQKKEWENRYQMLQLCTAVAGLGETPDTNSTLLEDLKSSEFSTPESGYNPSHVEILYNLAQKKKSESVPGQKFEKPPKRLFKELQEQYQEYARKPGGQAKLFELGKRFTDIIPEHHQALMAHDFDKAIKTLDKLVEADDPDFLPGLPFGDMSKNRQTLVSAREFEIVLEPAIKAMGEGRNEDATKIIESLLRDYELGKYPGLPDFLVQNARDNLQTQVWQRHFKMWYDAIENDDYPQAFMELRERRRLETSNAFSELVESQYGTFVAQDLTDFHHLMTLHRHYGEYRRPLVAFKIVSHLLLRYKASDATRPWLTPEILEDEQAYKWFYELEIHRAKYEQFFKEGDIPSAIQNSLATQAFWKNIPRGLSEKISPKVLKRVKFDTVPEAFRRVFSTFKPNMS